MSQKNRSPARGGARQQSSDHVQDSANIATAAQTQDISASNSLADLAARIRAEHEAATADLNSGLRHAMAAGELLIEAKAQIPHGQWLPWLAEHCTVSERTAQAYMRVARSFAKLDEPKAQRVADLSFRDALRSLAVAGSLLNQLPPESYDRALQSVESQESAETWKHAVRRVRIEDMQARNRGGLDTPRSVTVTMRREYSATIEIRAESQAAADRAALRRFEKWACDEGCQALPLGFPPPWKEHDSIDSDPEIDTRFRCVDCGKDTQGGEYYMVSDAAWAASGMESHGGMLCLADLERRIGRELTAQDFTCMWPSLEAWKRHLASRSANPTEPESPEQLLLEFASAGRAAS